MTLPAGSASERRSEPSRRDISADDAAVALGVPDHVVRGWIRSGVLETVASGGSVQIAESTLGEVLAGLRALRELEGDSVKMREVSDALHDRWTREQLEISIAELEAGEYVEVGPGDVDELFD